MNIKVLLLLFLSVSAIAAQSAPNVSKQASCLRETIAKLSNTGKIHAFGITQTAENTIVAMDDISVGEFRQSIEGENTTVSNGPKNSIKEITEEPKREEQPATFKTVDITKIEKDALTITIDGNKKLDAKTEKTPLKETKEVTHKLVEQAKKDEKNIGKLGKSLEDSKKTEADLQSQLITETEPAKIEELKNTCKTLRSKITRIEAQKAKVEKKVEATKAQITEMKKEASKFQDMDKETEKNMIIINGKKVLKDSLEKVKAIEQKITEVKAELKRIEEKAIREKKDPETITKELETKKLQIQKLIEQEGKVEKLIKKTQGKIETTTQQIKEIKKNCKKAVEKEMEKFGAKCTSYSIRPHNKFCVKKQIVNGKESCAEYKDIYRGEKCLKTGANGECLEKKFYFSENVNRYKCESHSTENEKTECTAWEEKDGKKACSRTEKFYAAKTCIEFAPKNGKVECVKYETRYPALRCSKTFTCAGEKTCQEMTAYAPRYFTKEFQMVNGHRFPKIQEVYFGKKVNVFQCAEAEKNKDTSDLSVHCIKYEKKTLDQFKNYKFTPVQGEQKGKIFAAKSETQCKKISATIQKEKKVLVECNKKIGELEKTLQRTLTPIEQKKCQKLILQEKNKIELITKRIEAQKTVLETVSSKVIEEKRLREKAQREADEINKRIADEKKKCKTIMTLIKKTEETLKNDKTNVTLQKKLEEEKEKLMKAKTVITDAKKEIKELKDKVITSTVNVKKIELQITKKVIEENLSKKREEITRKEEELARLRKEQENADEERRRKIVSEIKKCIFTIENGKKILTAEKKELIQTEKKIVKEELKKQKEEIKKIINKVVETKKKIEDEKRKITQSTSKIEITECKKKIQELKDKKEKLEREETRKELERQEKIVEEKKKEHLKKVVTEETKNEIKKFKNETTEKLVEDKKKIIEEERVKRLELEKSIKEKEKETKKLEEERKTRDEIERKEKETRRVIEEERKKQIELKKREEEVKRKIIEENKRIEEEKNKKITQEEERKREETRIQREKELVEIKRKEEECRRIKEEQTKKQELIRITRIEIEKKIEESKKKIEESKKIQQEKEKQITQCEKKITVIEKITKEECKNIKKEIKTEEKKTNTTTITKDGGKKTNTTTITKDGGKKTSTTTITKDGGKKTSSTTITKDGGKKTDKNTSTTTITKEGGKKTQEHVEKIIRKSDETEKIIRDRIVKEEQEIIKKKKQIVEEEKNKKIQQENQEKKKKIIEQTKRVITEEKERIEKHKKELETEEIKKSQCTNKSCRNEEEEKIEKIKITIVKEQKQLEESKKIIDGLKKIKCSACCCATHTNVIHRIYVDLNGDEFVTPVITMRSIVGKKAILQYLSTHQKELLDLYKQGKYTWYYKRIVSYRVKYSKNYRLMTQYNQAYRYCNKSKKFIRTHSYMVNGHKCGCVEAVRKYKVYRHRLNVYKTKMVRNHIALPKVKRVYTKKVYRRRAYGGRRVYRKKAYRRVYGGRRVYRKRVVVSRRQVRKTAVLSCKANDSACHRMLQQTNVEDVNLVNIMRNNISTFVGEDKALLNKCLA